MLVIGLTGGIGSGKTLASDHFERLGITVVDADKAARAVVEPGQPALQEIADAFGPGVIRPDGSLDRAALRGIVFDAPAQRAQLERITHPRIAEEIQRQLMASTSPYTLLVSPLLFESGQHRFAQRTLLIDAHEALQRHRAATRDGVSEKQIEAIMAAQMSREERRARADDVLLNDGNIAHLHAMVEQLHQRYLELARAAAQR
jgi:dephospho-CoA kinase